MSKKLRDLRKYRNLIVNGRLQGQLVAYCLGAYLIGCFVMGIAAFALYTRITPFLSANDTVLQAKIVSYFLTGGLPLVVGICLALGLISIVPYALYMSHRTAGPVVALRRYIQSMRMGNYQAGLELRSGDELQELANELLALAQVLEARESRVSEAHAKKIA